MKAIIVRHAYDIVEVDEDTATTLREICADDYEGDLTPWYVLDAWISDTDEIVELTIVDSVDDEVVTIYDDSL